MSKAKEIFTEIERCLKIDIYKLFQEIFSDFYTYPIHIFLRNIV
jgi:hypothetical protein